MGEPSNVSLQECIALHLNNIAWILSKIMHVLTLVFLYFKVVKYNELTDKSELLSPHVKMR